MGPETPGALTDISHIFNLGLSKSRDKPFLGRRPILSTQPLKFANHYVWETYADIDVRRRAVGSVLKNLFAAGTLKGAKYETVGIWSANRPGTFLDISESILLNSHFSEWQVVDLGVETYGMVSVALYDTLGKDAVGEQLCGLCDIQFCSLSNRIYH
jgi:long-chain acyl-CoA synthetase